MPPDHLSTNSSDLFLSEIPLAVIEWDLDCRVKRWNNQAEKIFGWTEKEALGQHANFIVPVAVQPLIQEIFTGLYSQSDYFRSTNQNLRKDGKIITCEWYNKPLVKENTVLSIISLVKDISIEISLKEQINAFLSASPGVACYIDYSLKYISVNESLAEFFGLEVADFINKPVGWLDESEQLRNHLKTFCKTATVQANWEVEINVNHQQFYFLISAKKYTEGIAISGFNITEKKELESALRASEERHTALIKALPQVLKSSSIRRSTESFETLIQQLTDDPVFSDSGIRELSTSQIEKLVKLEVEVRENTARLRQVERSLFTDRNSLNNRLKELEVHQDNDEENWKSMEADLFPFRTFGRIVKGTPGGLKTWLILVTLSIFISIFAIDIFIRYYQIDFQDLLNQIQKVE